MRGYVEVSVVHLATAQSKDMALHVKQFLFSLSFRGAGGWILLALNRAS